MITYQVETYSDVIEELLPLLAAHWRELALFKDEIPLDPDHGWYRKGSEAGVLQFFTVRADGVLIGYAVFVVIPRHPHYAHRWAHDDILWVAPEHRKSGVGNGLLDFCESELSKNGPVMIHINTKIHAPALAVLLQSRGYENVELGFSKRLA